MNTSSNWIERNWFDEDEIIEFTNCELGGHTLKYVSESGLYRILNRTNSPKARPFERWVTKEVLPSIRKTGNQIKNYKINNIGDKNMTENSQLVKTEVVNSQNKYEVTPFSFNNMEIRTLLINNEPYFIAMDVAKILEYSDAEAMVRRLDDDEIQNLQIVGFGNRGVNIINESGLYNAIIGSKKPQAKAFKKWIFEELIPSIKSTKTTNNNTIIPFSFENQNLDYIVLEDGEPLFHLNCIGRMLDIEQPRHHINTQDARYVRLISEGNTITIRNLNKVLNNAGELFLTEAGVYKLIFKSRKPSAERFQDWIACEVLPSIRKTGSYSITQQEFKPMTLKESLLLNLELVEKNEQLTIENKELKESNNKLEVFKKDVKLCEQQRRSKEELVSTLNRNIRALAVQKMNSNFKEAYNFVYSEFSKRHLINSKINMEYLRQNNDYLSECIMIVLDALG